MARKTIAVEYLKTELNRRLALPLQMMQPAERVAHRQAWASVLEDVLMETGNYRGYNDIHWMNEGGFEAWKAAGEPETNEKNKFIHGTPDGTDDYRRFYY